MKTIFCLTLILFILLNQNASAQRQTERRTGIMSPWEIGLSGGVSSFLTSINPQSGATNKRINYWNSDQNPGVALAVVRNLSPSLGIEMNWLNTRLSGRWNSKWPLPSDYPASGTPLTFNSQIKQLDLMMAFNINQILLPGDIEDLWHIYFKPGVGFTHIKNKMNPDENPVIKLSVALDAGLSVSLTERLKLVAGSTFRFVNTDLLDGVHVTSTDLNGKTVAYLKIFEVYNFSYLRLSYGLGNFGSERSKSEDDN